MRLIYLSLTFPPQERKGRDYSPSIFRFIYYQNDYKIAIFYLPICKLREKIGITKYEKAFSSPPFGIYLGNFYW